MPVTVMPVVEAIAKYHDLWCVEKSFRMSKSDLAAEPMFHRQRQAIEAHLTIVFTAPAVAHAIQSRTGLLHLQGHQIAAAPAQRHHQHQRRIQTFPPEIPAAEREILNHLGVKPGY